MNRPDIDRAVDEERALRILRRDVRSRYLREYTLRDGPAVVGRLELRGPIPPAGVQHLPDGDCRRSYAALAERHPELAGAYVVLESRVDPHLQNRGHGRRLYERAPRRGGVGEPRPHAGLVSRRRRSERRRPRDEARGRARVAQSEARVPTRGRRRLRKVAVKREDIDRIVDV